MIILHYLKKTYNDVIMILVKIKSIKYYKLAHEFYFCFEI